MEAFASCFVPFDFFKAGQGVTADEWDLAALLTGLAFLRVCTSVWLGEVDLKVFALAVADILRTRPDVPALNRP